MPKNSINLSDQVERILEIAEKKGVQTNFFFVTTFKRYQVQMKILADLEKEIAESGTTVRKEYVKGRENVYTNPAIAAYNQTAKSANGTVKTLIDVVKAFAHEEGESATNALAEFIKRIESDE